jgi:hypothetical protein
MMTGEMSGIKVKVSVKVGVKPSIRNAETGRFMKCQEPLTLHMKKLVGLFTPSRRLRRELLAMSAFIERKERRNKRVPDIARA